MHIIHTIASESLPASLNPNRQQAKTPLLPCRSTRPVAVTTTSPHHPNPAHSSDPRTPDHQTTNLPPSQYSTVQAYSPQPTNSYLLSRVPFSPTHSLTHSRTHTDLPIYPLSAFPSLVDACMHLMGNGKMAKEKLGNAMTEMK